MAKKITKKQRKMMKGANEMVRQCLRVGKKLGPVYVGKTPRFSDMRVAPHLPANFVKVMAGVPFINTTLRSK